MIDSEWLIRILQLLLASPRNTVKAQLSLFAKINCRTIVLCSSLGQSFQPLIAASKLRRVTAPGLEELLAENLVPHYAYDTTWEQLSDEKFLTMHTSGSSGMHTSKRAARRTD